MQNDILCAMMTLAHTINKKQDTPQKHHGPIQRVWEATKLNAETRDPPSQDPRDHKEQPSRHDIHPDTLFFFFLRFGRFALGTVLTIA